MAAATQDALGDHGVLEHRSAGRPEQRAVEVDEHGAGRISHATRYRPAADRRVRRRNCTSGAPSWPATAIGTARVDMAHGSVGAHRPWTRQRDRQGGKAVPSH